MDYLFSYHLCFSEFFGNLLNFKDVEAVKRPLLCVSTFSLGQTLCLISVPGAHASDNIKNNAVYEVGEFFELGIQLSYLLLLLGFLGVGTFFVIRQVLVRRELDLSAKELQVTPVSFHHALLISSFSLTMTSVKQQR